MAGDTLGATWVNVNPAGDYRNFQVALSQLGKPFDINQPAWFTAKVYVLQSESAVAPNITVNVATPIGADDSAPSVPSGAGTSDTGGPPPVVMQRNSSNGETELVFSGPSPVDASSKNAVPSLAPVANADGSIDVAWKRSDGQMYVSTWRGSGFQQAKHVPIRGSLGLLGGFARDDQGNGYLLTAREELVSAQRGVSQPYLRRPGILQILKIPAGQQADSLFVDLNQPSASSALQGVFNTKLGAFNPLIIGTGPERGYTTARLVHGNGVLAATFTHDIPSPDDGILHQTGSLLAVNTNGTPAYTKGAENHALDLRMVFDGSNFIRAQEGDQGILFSKLFRQSDGQWNWSNDKLIFRSQFAGELVGNGWGDDILRYIRLGGLGASAENYLLTYAYIEGGHISTQRDVEWGYGFNGPISGASLYVAIIPKHVETFPALDGSSAPQVPGVRHQRIASPDGDNNIARPRLVDMKNGTFMAIWEQWTRHQQYISTHAMLIDGQGNPQGSATLLPNARNQRATDAFYLPKLQRAGWVSGDSTRGKIMLHTIDDRLQLQSFALPIE